MLHSGHCPKAAALAAAALAPAAFAAAALAAGGCAGPWSGAKDPDCIRVVDQQTGEPTKACLPVASHDKRVDLGRPTFSNPTSITNPLHPTSKVTQTIYGGQVDGRPFRSEVTLLPEVKTLDWEGRKVQLVTSQYIGYLDGRVQEVALDWYAQADDGSVWYFGEDVFNYEDGAVADTDGTWLTGRDGPVAMIMPAGPKIGNVYRVENIPGKVFEEAEVKAVDQTVAGPNGPVKGAMTVRQLDIDGTYSEKIFAPGYGEFSTGKAGDLEVVSLAVPTDVLPAPAPAQLTALSAAVRDAVDAVGRNDWPRAQATTTALRHAWSAYQAVGVPAILNKQMTRDLDTLAGSVSNRAQGKAHDAALRVAQNDIDLRLRHQSVAAADLARLHLWASQVGVDAADRQPGAVAGDAVVLQRTWDRLRHLAEPAAANAVDTQLQTLRGAAEKKDADAAAKVVPALLTAFSAIHAN
jgi:hypothetical protein